MKNLLKILVLSVVMLGLNQPVFADHEGHEAKKDGAQCEMKKEKKNCCHEKSSKDSKQCEMKKEGKCDKDSKQCKMKQQCCAEKSCDKCKKMKKAMMETVSHLSGIVATATADLSKTDLSAKDRKAALKKLDKAAKLLERLSGVFSADIKHSKAKSEFAAVQSEARKMMK